MYHADPREVLTISGVGTWPSSVNTEIFRQEYESHVPEGILRTVVPAAPDAWITALERYGTMSFCDVASAAIRFASEGFVMYPLMSKLISANTEKYRRWPSNASIYLPGGEPPKVGDLFVQSDLGRTLKYMADEESASRSNGRKAGLMAARDAFYSGDIASQIIKFHEENGGWLRFQDLARFKVQVEKAISTNYRGVDVFTCGPWCQGPALLQALRLLDGFDLQEIGYNSESYVHIITEVLKLVFADRHHYYGDPLFVDVPMDILLSSDYADVRRELIDMNNAWANMPPGGDPFEMMAIGPSHDWGGGLNSSLGPALDTSYICVTDRNGNVFSATPSDTSYDTPVVPGTGLCPSSRGSQSWVDPKHPSCVAAGKRPRLTPNPAIAMRSGEFLMPFGSPGGDVQIQAMLQCFLNIFEWGMNPQQAVEAPRFATYSFPGSFEPHTCQPAKLILENNFSNNFSEGMGAIGHDIELWPEQAWQAGAVCLIKSDIKTGVHEAGADARRPAYAVGW